MISLVVVLGFPENLLVSPGGHARAAGVAALRQRPGRAAGRRRPGRAAPAAAQARRRRRRPRRRPARPRRLRRPEGGAAPRAARRPGAVLAMRPRPPGLMSEPPEELYRKWSSLDSPEVEEAVWSGL